MSQTLVEQQKKMNSIYYYGIHASNTGLVM